MNRRIVDIVDKCFGKIYFCYMIFNMCITRKKLYITTCKISIVDNAVKLSKLQIIESDFGIYK